jgi:hypothetical protein
VLFYSPDFRSHRGVLRRSDLLAAKKRNYAAFPTSCQHFDKTFLRNFINLLTLPPLRTVHCCIAVLINVERRDYSRQKKRLANQK